MERDYEDERKLGEYLLAKCAADLRRSTELQTELGRRLAEGIRLQDECENEGHSD